MKYKFLYHTSAFELWLLSMNGIYTSMIGVTNIIFTGAMVVLTAKFFIDANIFFRIILIMSISLFTVIQPLAIYGRVKKQIKLIPSNMEIGFDDYGIHLISSAQSSDIGWNKVKGIRSGKRFIVIYTDGKHGFIITDKMVGTDKKYFFEYLMKKTKK